MSDGKETSNVKLILECVALVVTIAATMFGAWTAMSDGRDAGSSDRGPAVAANTTPERNIDLSDVRLKPTAPRVAPALATTAASQSPESKTVTPASFVKGPSGETVEQLKAVLSQYPNALWETRSEVTGYEDGQLAVGVTLMMNQAVAGQFHDALARVLRDVQHVDSPVAISASARTQCFSLEDIGDARARKLLTDAIGEDTRTRVLVSVGPPIGGEYRAGAEANARFWTVDRTTSELLATSIQRAANATLRLEVVNAEGAVVARQSLATSFPEKPTSWSANRYVTTMVPLGSKWSLEKGLLAPEPALDEYHRKSANSGRVVGFLPCFLSTAERPGDRRASRRLTPAVTYRVSVPLRDDLASDSLTTRVSLVIPE